MKTILFLTVSLIAMLVAISLILFLTPEEQEPAKAVKAPPQPAITIDTSAAPADSQEPQHTKEPVVAGRDRGEDKEPALLVVSLSGCITAEGIPVAGATLWGCPVHEGDESEAFKGLRGMPESGNDGIAKVKLYLPKDMPEDGIIGVAAYHCYHGSAYAEYTLRDLLAISSEGLILDLERRHLLYGQVVDADGEPVPDAIVRLCTVYPVGGITQSQLEVRTLYDGTFCMAGIGFDNTPHILQTVYSPPGYQLRRHQFGRSTEPREGRRANVLTRLEGLYDAAEESTEIPQIRLPIAVAVGEDN